MKPDTGIPCAMVYGLLRALPGVHDLVSHRRLANVLQDLTPAQGCQDHAASPSASVPLVLRPEPSIASRATFRDDREPSLLSARDGGKMPLIWGFCQAEIPIYRISCWVECATELKYLIKSAVRRIAS
jgi:hypothetical protein